MMRETGRLFSLIVMLAGTIILAWQAFQYYGLVIGIVAGIGCLLITAATLRL